MVKDQIELYEEKEEITTNVKNKIKQLSIAKAPLTISISGKLDTPLKVSVKTPDTSFTVLSEINLVNTETGTAQPKKDDRQYTKSVDTKNKKSTARCLNYDSILKRLKALNNTEYYIKHLELENLQNDLFIPFKELTSIKKRILFLLNGSKEMIDPIEFPS